MGNLSREAAIAAYLAKQGSYRDIAKLAGVAAPTVMRWVKEWQSRGKVVQLVPDLPEEVASLTPNGRHSIKAASLDHTARTMLRKGAEKCLTAIAGDDLDEDEQWEPRRAKEAALTLAIIVDKCPGILGLDNATAAPAAAAIDATDLDSLAGYVSQLPEAVLTKALAQKKASG